MKKFGVWSSMVISLGIMTGATWAMDQRFNQASHVETMNESIKHNALAIQLHARDDMAIRVIELESQEIVTPAEREKILFYRDRMEQIDNLIMRLNR